MFVQLHSFLLVLGTPYEKEIMVMWRMEIGYIFGSMEGRERAKEFIISVHMWSIGAFADRLFVLCSVLK
jgi:hypothetical protein